MPRTRIYGARCRQCGKFMKLGEIELEDGASTEDLRNKLLEEEWRQGRKIVEHLPDLGGCGNGGWYSLDTVEFLFKTSSRIDD